MADTTTAFRFLLPEDGLALYSAQIVDGMPELKFKASPKVPTIQEEDVATIFRLVSEKKRPAFFYQGFPPTHPLHQSRCFMDYSPSWLRLTKVGKLLADADWTMKCLHVGARTNEDKSIFQSWSQSSQLPGLATHLDFPRVGGGSVIMSCKHAKVHQSDSEIWFPEEPTMQIKDDGSLFYSKYITEVYPSVAYYDEPKLLKMQELIKLILAVEWLYNEKGVQLDRDWILQHTTKSADDSKLQSKKPPHEMIPPQPTVVEVPSSDVGVMIRAEDIYKALSLDGLVKRRYGYYDFGGAELRVFKEDGTLYKQTECLKVSIRQEVTVGNMHAAFRQWLYIPTSAEALTAEGKKESQKKSLRDLLLPSTDTRDEVNPILGRVSVDIAEEEFTDESGQTEIKRTKSITPCDPSFNLPVMKAMVVVTTTLDDYKTLYAGVDPNELIRPEIPGVCEAVRPDVSSWDQLFSEFTVPRPHVWQDPYVGIGMPFATGGVTTRNFEVTREHVQPRVQETAAESVGVYSTGAENTLRVRAETCCHSNEVCDYKQREPVGDPKQGGASHFPPRDPAIHQQGKIRLVNVRSKEYADVSQKFAGSWKHKNPPPISCIFAISNQALKCKWRDYRSNVAVQKTTTKCFHGTTLRCQITTSKELCMNYDCGVCGIACQGMRRDCIRRNIDSFKQRFGNGYYFAIHSSKCHHYTGQPYCGYRALLLCEVVTGRKCVLKEDGRDLIEAPPGYDSVYGEDYPTAKVKYPEVVVYRHEAVQPQYIIVYQYND